MDYSSGLSINLAGCVEWDFAHARHICWGGGGGGAQTQIFFPEGGKGGKKKKR